MNDLQSTGYGAFRTFDTVLTHNWSLCCLFRPRAGFRPATCRRQKEKTWSRLPRFP